MMLTMLSTITALYFSFPVTPADRTEPIRDKTLVVWLTPAKLTQRGGSPLSLVDSQERFDAIGYGELAAGRWMAGSDSFQRSHRAQNDWPAETADETTLLAIAVVYRGR